MERPVNYRRWFFIRPPEEVVQVAVEEALRQLITQIFAGRRHIIVIRRELPRGYKRDCVNGHRIEQDRTRRTDDHKSEAN
jgi:hypothetical protein